MLDRFVCMPLEERLDCSETRVSDLSPLEGMPLRWLRIYGTGVEDLSPLEGMPLTFLGCGNTPVSDLSPLAAMPLEELHLTGTRVEDLTPLRGMKLQTFGFVNTSIRDISPLEGMPLQTLWMSESPADDLTALEGMPLERLTISWTAVTDLTPLQGAPLKLLGCLGLDSQQLVALKDAPLEHLGYDLLLFHGDDERIVRTLSVHEVRMRVDEDPLPVDVLWQELARRREAAQEFVERVAGLEAREQVQAVEQRLRELNPRFEGTIGRTIRDGQVQNVTLAIDQITDITPLRALAGLRSVTLTNEAPLGRGSLHDLSPLNSLPLEELNCDPRLVRRNRTMLAAIPTLRTIDRP